MNLDVFKYVSVAHLCMKKSLAGSSILHNFYPYNLFISLNTLIQRV